MSPDEYAAAVDRVAHAMKLAESAWNSWPAAPPAPYVNVWILGNAACLPKRTTISISSPAMPTTTNVGQIVARLSGKFDKTCNVHLHCGGMCRRSQKVPTQAIMHIALSFDEWGVWYSDVWNQQEAEWKAQSGKDLHHESWPKARVCSKISTMQPMQW